MRKRPELDGLRHALEVLEFPKVLGLLARHSETEMGCLRCLELVPSFEPGEVWERLRVTEEAYVLLSTDPPPSLSLTGNLSNPIDRSQKGGDLSGSELYQCACLLRLSRKLKDYFGGKGENAPFLTRLGSSLYFNDKLERELFESVTGSGELLDSASPELASLRSKMRSASLKIVSRMQEYLGSKVREWLSDPLYTTRSGRYVLPLKVENKSKLKGIVHDASSSGATVYIEPEDVVQMGNRLRETEAAEREEVLRVLREFSSRVGLIAGELISSFEIIGIIDFHFSCGRFAYDVKGCMPEASYATGINLQNGRHPLIPADKVIAVDIEVGVNTSVLITGPNTGGKTVAIKTAGLAVAMAQSGLFPLATHVTISPFMGLKADIGDEQSVLQSLSTFSGHIKNVAEAIRSSSTGFLILLDELGAGTDPAEGSALAIAVLKKLQSIGCAVLASTHYGELKAFAYETNGFSNAAMEFDLKTLQPTYRMILGAAGASQALRIAERYGIPGDVIEAAKSNLGTQQQDVARLLEELDLAQKRARKSQSEADQKSAQLEKAIAKANREASEAEEIRRSVRSKTAERLDEAMRTMRIETALILDEVRQAPSRKSVDQAKSILGELENRVRKSVLPDVALQIKNRSSDDLKVGDEVEVEGFSQSGQIIEVRNDGSVQVQIGLLRTLISNAKLRVRKKIRSTAQPRKEINTRATVAPSLAYQRANQMSNELHLRQMRAEDAVQKLEKFIDDAVLAGADSVRIVHGKGEGILRRITQDFLKKNPQITEFRDGETGEGGHGVTIARLR